VTIRTPVNKTEFELCSPYGGIIYLVCEDPPPSLSFDIIFHDVGRYPIYSRFDESIFMESQVLTAPWGEIETRFVIFTVPVSIFASGIDLPHACDQLDLMVGTMLGFLADESISPYRVVFDVEIGATHPNEDYLLFLPVENAETILTPTEPSEALFRFLHRIARLSLPRSELPDEVRGAISVLAVYVAAEKLWPDKKEGICLMIHTSSPLWLPFLKIYSESKKNAFPETLAQLRPKLKQGGATNNGQLMNRLFVKTLSHCCSKDLSHDFFGPNGLLSKRRRASDGGPSDGLLEYTLDVADTSLIPL
jgi:hypothetical protein